MGNYASTAELEARFDGDPETSNLTDNEESGTPDATVLAEVLDDAEGEIDSYAAVKYLVPLDVTDARAAARLKSVALDLAVWRLHVRSGSVSEVKQRSRDDAVEWLKMLAKGEVQVPQPATPTSTTSRTPIAAYGTAGTSDSSNRLFSRATQDGL
jgi:phage gp36-like protein